MNMKKFVVLSGLLLDVLFAHRQMLAQDAPVFVKATMKSGGLDITLKFDKALKSGAASMKSYGISFNYGSSCYSTRAGSKGHVISMDASRHSEGVVKIGVAESSTPSYIHSARIKHHSVSAINCNYEGIDGNFLRGTDGAKVADCGPGFTVKSRT